jgi:hypothetical protein
MLLFVGCAMRALPLSTPAPDIKANRGSSRRRKFDLQSNFNRGVFSINTHELLSSCDMQLATASKLAGNFAKLRQLCR